MAKTVSEIVKEAQRDYDGRIILVKADGYFRRFQIKLLKMKR